MTRLRSDEALNHFNTALDEKVGPVDVESPVIETAWNSLQEAINVTCKESIGHARRVNRDWFDENVVTLSTVAAYGKSFLSMAARRSLSTSLDCSMTI